MITIVDVVSIAEEEGPDLQELALSLAKEFGFSALKKEDMSLWLDEEQRYTQYSPVMKLILNDIEERYFRAQRMCNFGNKDDWIDIGYSKSIKELAKTLIPVLGTDQFFELF